MMTTNAMNGRCPHCQTLITYTYRRHGQITLGLMLASGAAGFVAAWLIR